MFPIATAA